MYVSDFKSVAFLIILLISMLAGCAETQNANMQVKNDSTVIPSEREISSKTYISEAVYKIEYSFVLLENNNVGNEWEKVVFVNGTEAESGQIIHAKDGESVEIKIFVSENDKIPDQNSKTVWLNIKDGASTYETIEVRENRGQYSGNTATWQFNCDVVKK